MAARPYAMELIPYLHLHNTFSFGSETRNVKRIPGGTGHYVLGCGPSEGLHLVTGGVDCKVPH